MTILYQWARAEGVPFEAIRRLEQLLRVYDEENVTGHGRSEAAVQAKVRTRGSELGMRLWRNNVGALPDRMGRMVRYGLCNESPRMNASIKSSDLIGIRPVLIGPEHLGTIIGQFVAREVKEEDWRYSGDTHEQAQLRFLEIVLALGGDAAFINHENQLT